MVCLLFAFFHAHYLVNQSVRSIYKLTGRLYTCEIDFANCLIPIMI